MHALAEQSDLARKSLPWIFYGQTTSLCETCLELVPAKIIGEDGKVFYQKRCPEHGVMKTLVEEDAGYWLSRSLWLKPGDRPLHHASRTERGCPWDCGLCPDHEQHSCLAIVEINDACNLSCPVCFADSAVGRGGHRPLAEVEAMLDAVVRAEGEPDLVQLSGGEPTIHPQFWEIVAAARSRPIRQSPARSSPTIGATSACAKSRTRACNCCWSGVRSKFMSQFPPCAPRMHRMPCGSCWRATGTASQGP